MQTPVKKRTIQKYFINFEQGGINLRRALQEDTNPRMIFSIYINQISRNDKTKEKIIGKIRKLSKNFEPSNQEISMQLNFNY